AGELRARRGRAAACRRPLRALDARPRGHEDDAHGEPRAEAVGPRWDGGRARDLDLAEPGRRSRDAAARLPGSAVRLGVPAELDDGAGWDAFVRTAAHRH